MLGENVSPVENESTKFTAIFTISAGLVVSFPVGVYRISFAASRTCPFLFAVLPTEVLLDSGKVAQCSGTVVMDARLNWADVNPFPHLLTRSSCKLPRLLVQS